MQNQRALSGLPDRRNQRKSKRGLLSPLLLASQRLCVSRLESNLLDA